jgi:hypothetical protein
MSKAALEQGDVVARLWRTLLCNLQQVGTDAVVVGILIVGYKPHIHE